MLRKFSSMWRKEVPVVVPGECVDVNGGGQDTAVTGRGAAGWCEDRQGESCLGRLWSANPGPV